MSRVMQDVFSFMPVALLNHQQDFCSTLIKTNLVKRNDKKLVDMRKADSRSTILTPGSVISDVSQLAARGRSRCRK